jgi:TorA maturation chaperone TorD
MADGQLLACLRGGLYRLFATILLPPEEARLAQLALGASELREYDRALARLPFFGSWRQLRQALPVSPAAVGGQLRELEAAYSRLFVPDLVETPCPPYESHYIDPGGEAIESIHTQLVCDYLAAGVAVDPGSEKRPDHVTIELEFMAYLCDQEAGAWESVRSSDGSIATRDRLAQGLASQCAFLSRHLGVWFPAFASRVNAAGKDGFYPLAATAAHAFIHHDRDVVATLYAAARSGLR